MGSKSLISLVFVVSIALYGALAIAASGVYQTRTEFLQEALGTEKPDSDVVWMNAELRDVVTKVLGHPPAMLRMRYWYDASRTAWIIDEIGKEKPITLGIVVENQEIQSFSVLQFRESRGWEIRYPFFTNQFAALRLGKSGSMSQDIDGISGATLSVRAATRSANLALVLDEYTKRRTQAAATTR
ncbi:MAG: FMN-binding protein [Woeseia sp.]|jgi:hypothetical protein|nr:FMN-binding protein [Woeseia sp.]MBT6210507.1 FMN-binding protein [Woeseia sp.]